MSEQSLPEPGDRYRHLRNGREYVVCEIVQLENPEPQEWEGAVLYRDPGMRFVRYVRTMGRFLSRFEFIRRGEE